MLWGTVTINFTCVRDGVTGSSCLVKRDSGRFRAGVLGEADGHIHEPRKEVAHPRASGPRPISRRSQKPRKADPLPSKGDPFGLPWASSASDLDPQSFFLRPQLADPPAHVGARQPPQSHEPVLAT